jgi:hypothetical protein
MRETGITTHRTKYHECKNEGSAQRWAMGSTIPQSVLLRTDAAIE